MSKELVKISFEYLLDDGSRQIRFLENEEARKWEEKMKQVCVYAEIHRRNPSWNDLNWQEKLETDK